MVPINNNFRKYAEDYLSKAQQWAVGGGLAAGGVIALKQLLHALTSKKYRKNYSFTKGLRNILLGGLLGSGAAYGLNKGISNYTVNSMKADPFAYSGDKVKYFKPDGFDTLLDSKSSLSERKDAMLKTLKDVWYRTTTTPNLENLKLDYKGNLLSEYTQLLSKDRKDDWDLRQELLAKTFGVFDESKGTAFRNLNKDEINILKNQFPWVYKPYVNLFGEKNLLTPKNPEQIFPDNDSLNRLNNFAVFDRTGNYSNVNKKVLREELFDRTTYPTAPNVLLHYANHLSDDHKYRAYSDIWDYEPSEEEIKPFRDELKNRWDTLKEGDLSQAIRKLNINDQNNVIPRYIVSKLLVNPVSIVGTQKNDMELQKKWENIYMILDKKAREALAS